MDTMHGIFYWMGDFYYILKSQEKFGGVRKIMLMILLF